jgi:hypothetical protein
MARATIWKVCGLSSALAFGGCSGDDEHGTGMSDDISGSGTRETEAADTTAASTGEPDGSASASASATAPASGTDDSTGAGGIKFDVGTDTDGDVVDCGCGNADWSYVWIANSPESTVSKINTRTMVEEGRYLTRADANGSPSRTSVSVDGRAVVVANRNGGLTKIWSRPEFCDPMKNGQPGLQTSSGANDVLSFTQDDCIAWSNDFDGMSVQRPVAWTSGVLDPTTCEYEDQKVWTVTGQGGNPGMCGPNGLFVHLVDGETGVTEETIHIPEAEEACGSLGAYGAAVDPDNNLWFYIWARWRVIRVDYETKTYTSYQGGSYGITVDTVGRPWVGDSPQRFDVGLTQWESANPNLPGAGGAGIAQDLQGRMWTATSNGVGWVDMETLQLGDTVTLPIMGLYRGISVDIDGYIWAVRLGGSEAFKIDPDDYTYEMVDGLNGPYTYSDMTGGQINNVTCNPAG